MKTSHKEGVSERPPTPISCPNMRHRSSAATVDISSPQSDAVQAGSDTRAAPTPLPRRRAAQYVTAIAVDVDPFVQRLPKPSTVATAHVDDLDILRNRRGPADADGLVCARQTVARRSHPDRGPRQRRLLRRRGLDEREDLPRIRDRRRARPSRARSELASSRHPGGRIPERRTFGGPWSKSVRVSEWCRSCRRRRPSGQRVPEAM